MSFTCPRRSVNDNADSKTVGTIATSLLMVCLPLHLSRYRVPFSRLDFAIELCRRARPRPVLRLIVALDSCLPSFMFLLHAPATDGRNPCRRQPVAALLASPR